MAEIIGVRFKENGKIYYFDPKGMTFAQNEKVIVETARGVECGMVALPNKNIDNQEFPMTLKPVLRRATEKDLRHIEDNHRREAEAIKICEGKIAEHGLDMKLVEAECTFDNSKLLFYFTSDGRVDFRELVKDLAVIFRTRIELRQIGVRDEARMLGGLGVCGRPLCCSSFLDDFQPVSIKMAKEQGLSLAPVKISGTCGRLMCCLKYALEAYTDLIAHAPKVGTLVKTPLGRGVVTEMALLTGIVKVKMDGSFEGAAPQVFALEQLRTLDDEVYKVAEPKEEPEDEFDYGFMLFDEAPEDNKSQGKKRSGRNQRSNNRKKPQQNQSRKQNTQQKQQQPTQQKQQPQQPKPQQPKQQPQQQPKPKQEQKDYSDYTPKEKNRQKKSAKGKPVPKNNKKPNFNKAERSRQPHYRKPKGEKNQA